MGSSSASAFKSVVGIILTALIGVPLFAYLAIKLFTSGMSTDVTSSTMTKEAVTARLQPVAVVKVVDGGPPGSKSGKAVYEAVCISCHGSGLAGSPKFSDVAAWAPRIGQGFDTLVKHAVGGFKAMPAKGGATDLTDDEVKRGVAFMANAAGAKFEEPKVAGTAGGAIDPAVRGKEIYATVCVACHDSGAAGAPKFGDKAAWAPRLKDGVDNALAIAIKGLNAMPPKGGFGGSDEEFKAAALYMINASK
jgi:cytochrome c5